MDTIQFPGHFVFIMQVSHVICFNFDMKFKMRLHEK